MPIHANIAGTHYTVELQSVLRLLIHHLSKLVFRRLFEHGTTLTGDYIAYSILASQPTNENCPTIVSQLIQ